MLELLSKPEYQHVLLNHLPITALAAALVALLGSWILGQRRATIFCIFLVALFAATIWPVAATGDAAHDRVEALVYKEGAAWLAYHNHLVDLWGWVYYLTAVAALAGGIMAILRKEWTKWAALLTSLLAVASLAAGTIIAEAGGKIRHEEFRNGPPPAVAEHDHGD